jgi:hypothetical protein
MTRALLLLSLLLLPSLAGAQAIYKWRDASGKLHFSDQPRDGAEKVELRSPSTFDASATPPASQPTRDEPPADLIPYRRFAFTSPAPEATVRQPELTVTMRLEPALRPGHRVRLLLDGTPVATQPGTVFPLEGLERGAHTVSAQILDASDKVIAHAGPITFHVHRPSVLLRPN